MSTLETGFGAACAFSGVVAVGSTSAGAPFYRISKRGVDQGRKQRSLMMSRVYLATACLRGKPDSQHAGAALKGLQQLCTWAAEGSKVDSQKSTPAFQSTHQQTSRQGHSQSQTRSQPTSRQAASQSKSTAGPKSLQEQLPCHYIGHQKQRRSNRDQVRQTGEYIKVCKNQLLESVRGPQPDLALQSFYGDILFLCSQPGASIDPSHLNAIIGATAKSWTPACARLGQQEQQQARHEVHAFLTKMMQRLQPLLPDVGAREAANLLWSSAKLGLNPDALVPGMTDSLARHFMGDMDAATGQGFANVLVACAQLQLSPCQGGLFKAILNRLVTADLSKFDPQNVANTLHSLVTIPAVAPSVEVLDALCQRLGVQLKSRQVTELPDAQSIANTMWALSKLKHAPSDELAMSMVGRMVALCRVPGQQPTAQAISNVLLAFAQLRLPVKQADTDNLASFFLSSKRRWINVLDALCQRFGVLLNSRPAAELPVAQSIANTLWALSKLKHAPSDQLAMSMVGRMVALCCVPGQQPTPQAISNVLLACAELSVPVKQADTDSLASFLLSSNKRQGTQQAYANTAWSLAVIGHLRQAQFMLLLDQMFALSGSPGEMSTPPLLTAAQLTQLYQAQDWLQPHPTAPAQQLHRLGPRPAPDKPPFFGIHKLCAALNQLQLSFKAMGGQHHMHHAMGGAHH